MKKDNLDKLDILINKFDKLNNRLDEINIELDNSIAELDFSKPLFERHQHTNFKKKKHIKILEKLYEIKETHATLKKLNIDTDTEYFAGEKHIIETLIKFIEELK